MKILKVKCYEYGRKIEAIIRGNTKTVAGD
jgi:hypothetical protein